MKKHVLTISVMLFGMILIASCIKVGAQPRKASILIGSSYGLPGKKIGDNTETSTGNSDLSIPDKKDELLSLGFTPRIGYHLSYHSVVGISIKYGKKILNDNGKMDLFTYGPFLRYYLLEKKLAPYLEIEAGTGKYNESGPGTSSNKSDILYLSGGGGIEYYISRTVSFDAGVNYKTTREKFEIPTGPDKEILNNLNFRAGLSLHLIWKEKIKDRRKINRQGNS